MPQIDAIAMTRAVRPAPIPRRCGLHAIIEEGGMKQATGDQCHAEAVDDS